MEVPAPVIDVGLKAAVTPLGMPLAVSVTGELKPLVMVSVTVEVAVVVVVLLAVSEAFVALSEKAGAWTAATAKIRSSWSSYEPVVHTAADPPERKLARTACKPPAGRV